MFKITAFINSVFCAAYTVVCNTLFVVLGNAEYWGREIFVRSLDTMTEEKLCV